MAAAPRLATRLHIGGDTDDALRAEHGFSALVTVNQGGRETRVLFDAGRTPDGLVENMRRLDLSPGDIDIIVLSHGHWDHVTGMDGLVRRLGSARTPVLIHPEFWTRRRLAFPGRYPVELPTTSKAALQEAGFEIVEQRQPSFLLDSALLVTGEVDRTTEFERGFPGHEAHRHGGWEPDPLILDDQALVASVRGHGLVVLTGCGHSGIINILRYVRKLTGEHRIHAVRRRLPPQREGIRADHRRDLRRARRLLARRPGTGALHGLARHPRARRALPAGVHPKQCRHAVRVRRGSARGGPAMSSRAAAADRDSLVASNEGTIEAWNGVLFDRFLRFRDIVTTGLGAHGEHAQRLHPPRPGDRALDVGCGFGDTTRRLAELVGPDGEAVGVDAAPRFIDAARRETAQAAVANARFLVADVQSCELDGGFDYVFSASGRCSSPIQWSP